jgi:hypothetical protein
MSLFSVRRWQDVYLPIFSSRRWSAIAKGHHQKEKKKHRDDITLFDVTLFAASTGVTLASTLASLTRIHFLDDGRMCVFLSRPRYLVYKVKIVINI